jgi:hypothetical protein
MKVFSPSSFEYPETDLWNIACNETFCMQDIEVGKRGKGGPSPIPIPIHILTTSDRYLGRRMKKIMQMKTVYTVLMWPSGY